MLAQKQPHIQRVRNSSLVERSCAPKLRDAQASVGEHCQSAEAIPRGVVEFWEERMPE